MEGRDEMEIFVTLTKYNMYSVKKVTAARGDYFVYFRYSLYVPPTGREWHEAFFKVGPGAGL